MFQKEKEKKLLLVQYFKIYYLLLPTNKNPGWNTKAEPQVILIVLKFYIINLFIINEFCIFLKGLTKIKTKNKITAHGHFFELHLCKCSGTRTKGKLTDLIKPQLLLISKQVFLYIGKTHVSILLWPPKNDKEEIHPGLSL